MIARLIIINIVLGIDFCPDGGGAKESTPASKGSRTLQQIAEEIR